MASPRKLEGTHRSLGKLVCDRCGYKASIDQIGRSVMKSHLSAKHSQDPASPSAPEAVSLLDTGQD